MIYLDCAASAPPYEAVCETVCQIQREVYANPSSLHAAAAPARRILRQSRKTMADLLGVDAAEVYFTSGGTESNTTAILCGAAVFPEKRHILIGAGEHSSVLAPAKLLRTWGCTVELLPTDACGRILPETLAARLRKDTALVSVQAVNNETGVIQDIAALSELCRSFGAIFHCDAVQGFGHARLPLHLPDLVSLSAHKFGGVRGAGCLTVRRGLPLPPLIRGGGQELGLRAGTENIPAIAGMSQAAVLAYDELEAEQPRLRRLSALLLNTLQAEAPEIRLHAAEADRIPGILSLHFPGLDGEKLLVRLDARGICISVGAACASGSREASHVLRAMGVSEQSARQSVRVSPGRLTTEDEILTAARAMLDIYKMR